MFAKRAIGLAVTAVSIYLVIPSLSATFSSWPELERLREGSLLVMAVLTLFSTFCLWVLLGICMRSRSWGLMATSQLASSSIARILPGGAATATAVQYRLLNDAGIDKTTAGTGLTVATLLNFAVLFAMPVFAVPAILSGPVDDALVNGAIVAAIAFVGAAVIGGLFLLRDRPLVVLGRSIDAVAARFGRLDSEAMPRADRLLQSRDLIRSHLATSWYKAVLASCGKWALDYLALVMAVRGAGHNDTSSVLVLAFVTATLLGRIPFTPGGLGFVEAGLTGTLILAGLSAGDAAITTLAYRLVTYWLPIPLGALAYGWYRLRRRRDGVELGPLSARGVEDIAAFAGGPLPN